jgi:enoyl-CoA hydratase/carnithine racemase
VLRIEDRERVRLVTLSRPEVLNAFDTRMWNAFADALSGAAASPYVAAVVVTGEGRAFSAGQDLSEMASLGGIPGSGAPAADGHGFARCLDTLAGFEKPLLAAVNGVGVGFGLTLLLHCDIVLIADGARLKAPFVSLGVVPEAASSYLLPEVMGWQAAAHALLTADWIDAAQAVASGLAWRRCAPERLLPETLAVAGAIAAHPIESLVATKHLMRAGRVEPVAAARRREDDAFRRMVGAPANRAALEAFLAKPAPDAAGMAIATVAEDLAP